ncbi:Cof-type HAD-IIB family hydrolase [Enterococcus sp. HY326]|uniref:Cof-type HAD-IIB family hydrolase n=1 Tax=Enterococcus sp. HY326 TaxID=2971265 RepID=UPI002240832C|nr:Cof-type HAD-IIB family hydrolase [Enterococcus sp. HY326]
MSLISTPNIAIAFFDIDGTLINPRQMTMNITDGIPDSTRLAIQKLKEKGIIPVIATGRWSGVVKALADSLGIETVITSNGQEIIHEGQAIYQRFIEPDIMAKIVPEIEARNLAVFYDTQKGIFVPQLVQPLMDRGISVNQLAVGEIPQNVFQILVTAEDKSVVTGWLKDLKVVKTAPNSLDIFPEGVSKAAGIKVLLEKLGLTVDQAVAFGDEENDLEMFDAVGIPVAMGNAIQPLKDKAAFVTKAVWDDGIYYACQELGLI